MMKKLCEVWYESDLRPSLCLLFYRMNTVLGFSTVNLPQSIECLTSRAVEVFPWKGLKQSLWCRESAQHNSSPSYGVER